MEISLQPNHSIYWVFIFYFQQQDEDNQKAGLCLALLEIGAVEQANAVMDRLPKFSLLDEPTIVKALCFLIHSTVDPLYQR